MQAPSTAINRRQFTRLLGATAGGLALAPLVQAAQEKFSLRYLVGSSMYGYTNVAEILPEVHQAGATAIDIWPKGQGNQREQLDEMGEEKFAALIEKHHVSLGCLSQYKLGPFGLRDEMRLAKRLGCQTIITGGRGPRGLKGTALKAAVGAFIEKLKPQLAVAEETGVTIAIENHVNNLIDSPDSLKWLAELRPSEHLGVALAPYHLPQDEKLLADLIKTLGGSIALLYAWQHGMGNSKDLSKEQELLQMPGRGKLDFAPLLSALKSIHYRGWTEIFMHPASRGTPILPTTAAVTAEINRSRAYLTRLL